MAAQGDGDEEQESWRAKINGKKKAKEKKKRKGKRKRIEGTDVEDNVLPVVQELGPRQPLDPLTLNNSILTGVLTPPDEDLQVNIDPCSATTINSHYNNRLYP